MEKTIVAEAKVEKLDDFFAIEQKLMANETLRKTRCPAEAA